jgi:hypothetical protein
MMKSAGSRPVILQEIGFPASPLTGSSDAKQAEFIHAAYGQIDRYGSRIPLASYFLQTDFAPALTKLLSQYYGMADPAFEGFLGTLGLHDSTGRARPAWSAFRAEMIRRRPLKE